MTDAEGQNTNFSMSSDAEKSNAKRHFKYMEEEDGEETGLDIILTHKGTLQSKQNTYRNVLFLKISNWRIIWRLV